jgi:hypothetical protein
VKLDDTLARLFDVVTWSATAVIALGLVAGSTPVVVAGIAAIVALPAAGLLVMLASFVREGDLRGVLIALLVLAVLAAGVALT